MRVLSAKESHFQNLLGIKELAPSKLKLGYVALAPEDSINLSLLLREQRDQPICVTAEVPLCQLTVCENCNKPHFQTFLVNSFYHSSQSSFSSWAVPQGKILKTVDYYSKIEKHRPGENKKQHDARRKRPKSFGFFQSIRTHQCLIHMQCDFREIQLQRGSGCRSLLTHKSKGRTQMTTSCGKRKENAQLKESGDNKNK